MSASWAGGQSVHDREQRPNRLPDRRIGNGLRDAGFVSLITGDTRYQDKVRDILIQQTGIAGTDFSNSVKWPRTYVWHSKDFKVVNWLRKLTYGYSYIRFSISESDRQRIDRWLFHAADFWDNVRGDLENEMLI